jgi:plasmid stabilization system protein ParE
VRSYLTQPGAGPAAKARIEAITAAIRDLGEFPLVWPKGEVPGTRERVVAEHIIVFEVDNDIGAGSVVGDITVLRVLGPGQNRRFP